MRTSASARCMLSYDSSWLLNAICTPSQNSWLLDTLPASSLAWSAALSLQKTYQRSQSSSACKDTGSPSFFCKNELRIICELAVYFSNFVNRNNLLKNCLFWGILHLLLQLATVRLPMALLSTVIAVSIKLLYLLILDWYFGGHATTFCLFVGTVCFLCIAIPVKTFKTISVPFFTVLNLLLPPPWGQIFVS